MCISYFNHTSCVAQSRWERGRFLAQWWRIYAGDPYWAPPHYPTLRRELEPSCNSHLARMRPVFVHCEALPRRQASSGTSSGPASGLAVGIVDAQPVATAVALHDPRRRDRTLYLALVRCVNDTPSLERLLSYLAEEVQASGCHRVIGPIGLSPHLDSGLLEDCWNETPPLHTSYNPPYLPELFKSVLRPLGASRLYQLEIPAELPPAPRAQAQLYPLEPARLAQDLLPVLAAACSAWLDFPSPDAEEAAFLLRWLGRWPLYGWLAQLDERPVGFVLLQPDAAPLLRRAHGARDLLWRLWLARCSCSRLRQGRVLYGGVLPEWQGQGVGRQLLHQALVTGHQLSWQRLRIGPLPDTAPAGAFLERHGARPRQTYRIYEGDL